LFHQRYLESFDFLSKFETKCSQFDKDIKNRLKKSNPYKYFIKKWPIQVYFQIRFQEIVFKLEEDLINYHLFVVYDSNEDYDFDQNSFSLNISDTLVKQMEYCWLETKCYLKSLLSNFWKLNLQLVSRFSFYFIQMFQTKLGQLDMESQLIKETDNSSGINSEDQINNENKQQQIIDDFKIAVFLLFDAYKLQTLRVNIYLKLLKKNSNLKFLISCQIFSME
jgi:hypothetical protein